MDTILYFYAKKGLKAPEPEPVGLKSYMLVRVALDVGEDSWFGEKLGMPDEGRGRTAETAPESGPEAQEDCPDRQKSCPGSRMREAPPDDGDGRAGGPKKRIRGIWKVWGRLWGSEHRATLSQGEVPGQGRGGRRGGRFRKGCTARLEERAEAARREALLAEREERIRRTEASIKRLAQEVTEMVGEGNLCHCVYDKCVRKALIRNRGHGLLLPVLWQRYFIWKEFADYASRFWVELLMPEAVLPHFVILGTAACIPEILEKYACGMKSLRWVLAEADRTPELENFVDDFYTESGLAISMQTVPGQGDFRRLRQICVLPSNILDFTKEPGIGTYGAAEGSIWLDMQSVEEKRRRIQGRGPGISYFSIKEKWKYAQRRCKSPVSP